MSGAEFVPFWKQSVVACSDPQLRVSLWRKPGRLLFAAVNFTDRERSAELRLSAGSTAAQFCPAWKAEHFEPTKGGARLTIPAKRGAMLFVTLLESRP